MVAGKGGAGAMKRTLIKDSWDLSPSGLDGDAVIAYRYLGDFVSVYSETAKAKNSRVYADIGSVCMRIW